MLEPAASKGADSTACVTCWPPPLPSPPPLPGFLRNEPWCCLLPAATEETARFCGVEPRVLRGLPHDVMLATGWESAADEVAEWCRTL